VCEKPFNVIKDSDINKNIQKAFDINPPQVLGAIKAVEGKNVIYEGLKKS
jgi:hypothetical protein